MGIEVRKISWWDTLRLQLFLSVPSFLLGLVAPNRWFVFLISRWNGGRSTMRLLSDLRERYRCDHLKVWFPGGSTLLVMNPDTMDAVLVSDENAADPALKKRALSRFAPDGVIISSGDAWRERRDFNENALCTGRLHRHADAFRDIAFDEAERLTQRAGELRWVDFQMLGERISQQVILGTGQLSPDMTSQLARLVRRANLLLRNESAFAAFYGHIDRYLADSSQAPIAGCLMHDSAAQLEGGSARESTRVPAQIAFWFFVLKDAVELHVARTLALIAAHPDVQTRVRAEIQHAGTLNVQAIEGLHYLDACMREQLRLWTPVPILLRRAVRAFSLRGEIPIAAGEQILIHTGFYHRDPRFFGELADKFSPDAMTSAHPTVYSFSAQRQSCAGRSLVTFVLRATLASLLGRFRFDLVGPTVEPDRIPYLYDHFSVVLRPLATA